MNREAGLHVITTRSTYPIAGSTPADLRGAIRLLGPTRDGRTYGGFTDWRISFWFEVKEESAGVRVAAARVEACAHVLLPRWRPPRSASPALAAEWTRYMAAVEAHERGHVDVAVEAARSLLGSLEALAGFPDVSALRAAASAAADAVIASAHERERGYDESTQHGAAEGAWLGDGDAARTGAERA